MQSPISKRRILLISGLLVLNAGWTAAQTAEITYQGRLASGGTTANGNHDFEFTLYKEPVGGLPLETRTRLAVPVTGGLFTVRLDFSTTTFDGVDLFLEIAVKGTGSPDPYTILDPRQPITSAPYSIHSLNADTATDSTMLGGVGAGQFVQTTDPRLSDARNPLPGSANYIQNATTQQPSSNFNVSGTGAAAVFDATTQFNINAERVFAVPGSQNVFAGRYSGLANTSGFGNTFVGHFAGTLNTTGFNNSIVGTDAGRSISTGAGNSFLGRSAGYDTTTGTSNSFFGLDAGRFNVTGSSNSFFGESTGRNATGNNNSFFGRIAGYNTTTGVQNTFVGGAAGFSNTTGSNNTALGYNAGVGASGLDHATVIGAEAVVATSNTIVLGRSGGQDTVQVPGNLTIVGTLGADVLNATTQFNIAGERVLAVPGSQNLFVGRFSGTSNSGFGNTFLGHFAGTLNTTGFNNTLVGTDAGRSIGTSSGNTFVGRSAGFDTTTGTYNSFFGLDAGRFNTTGDNNSFFGRIAGYNTSTGVQNTFVGRQAGFTNTTGSNNTALGYNAEVAAPGLDHATVIGAEAVVATSNTIMLGRSGGQDTVQAPGTLNANILNAATEFDLGGARVLSVPGSNNVFAGVGSGAANTTGSANSFFGRSAGSANTSGGLNAFFGHLAGANSTGSANSFFGGQAGLGNTTGDDNAFFGVDAGFGTTTGQQNTFIGRASGGGNVTGSNNTTLGYGANLGGSNLNFATAIGSDVTVSTSNTVRIGRSTDTVRVTNDLVVEDALTVTGNAVVTTLGLAGATDVCRNAANQLSTCSSSLRYKSDVRPFLGGLDTVGRLRPIAFTWRDGGTRDVGFGAEDVAAIEPLLATYDGQGHIEGVKYKQLTTVLVNAVQQQQAQIAEQQRIIEALRRLVCQTHDDTELCRP